MTEEGKVKAKINAILKKYPIYEYMPVPYGLGKSSLDYLICAGGQFIAIEAKKPYAEPTARQDETIRQIKAAGGKVFIIDGTRMTDSYQSLDNYLSIVCNFTK